jgi:hypothetical protein
MGAFEFNIFSCFFRIFRLVVSFLARVHSLAHRSGVAHVQAVGQSVVRHGTVAIRQSGAVHLARVSLAQLLVGY